MLAAGGSCRGIEHLEEGFRGSGGVKICGCCRQTGRPPKVEEREEGGGEEVFRDAGRNV